MLSDNTCESHLMPLVLQRRGWDNTWLATHTDPHHQDLGSLDEMCQQLKNLHDQKKFLVILPDFDTDGVMAGVIGWAGLNQLGIPTALYAPHPENGYGITIDDIQRAEQQWPQVSAFITCDVGITCHEALAYAQQQGKTVLVTDHHEPDASPIEADCVVDPSADKESYGWDGICGAHVFWQILQRYACLYVPSQVEAIEKLRVFAGIATISDMMPLWKENRLLVQQSLADSQKIMAASPESLFDNTPVGAALSGLCILYQAFLKNGLLHLPLDEQTYGWTIAPAINSLKRLEKPLGIVQLIFTSPYISDKYSYADELTRTSSDRKTLVSQKTALLEASLKNHQQPFAPYILIVDAPSGILGLLANTIMSDTKLPVLVLREIKPGCYTGSGRSPQWFDFLAWLREEQLGEAAGHAQAFGYHVECSHNDLQTLCDHIHSIAQQMKPTALPELEFDYSVGTTQTSDALVTDVTDFQAFLHDCDRFAPWGENWPKPVARLDIPDSASWVEMSHGRHAKCRLSDHVEVVLWNTSVATAQNAAANHHLLATMALNEWNGNRTIQFTGTVK